jgi:peptidoglycan/xylan/chitin deacetylase (PgdA/CDA1 family)
MLTTTINTILKIIKRLLNILTSYDNSVIILMYHSIPIDYNNRDDLGLSVPKDLFERQIKYLVDKKYNVIPLQNAVHQIKTGYKISKRTVCITFDDGYEDNYHNAVPILIKENMPATIFLITKYLKENANFSHLERHNIVDRPMTAEQINDVISKSNLIHFSSHASTHQRLSNLPVDKACDEITKSIKELKDFGLSTKLFAYPYGGLQEQKDEFITTMKEVGIEAACTTTTGINRAGENPYYLKRLHISQSDDEIIFEEKLIGLHEWKVRINNFIKILRP